ncbi:MAG TPA: ATP-binding cassette domain-containing protein, partial [Tepidisphaeraceae bacterium]
MNPPPVDMPPDLLLRVRGLTKFYGGDKKTAPMKALDDIRFDLKRGETLGVVGESGSGKTTAARCVLRAIDPSAGHAWFNNNGRVTDLAAAT